MMVAEEFTIEMRVNESIEKFNAKVYSQKPTKYNSIRERVIYQTLTDFAKHYLFNSDEQEKLDVNNNVCSFVQHYGETHFERQTYLDFYFNLTYHPNQKENTA